MRRLFRAPGKVVLLGEYAVLDGAPAVVAALDRGVSCTVTPADAVEIDTPADDRFARAALSQAEAPPARYTFQDWNPPATETKAGLGGSAAAAVVAVLAARALRGAPTDAASLFADALAAHRDVQGSGSGIDVAASAFGGVSRFEGGAITPLPVPPHLVVVWSGQSARTGPRVQRYLAWNGRAAFVAASTACVARFAEAPIDALADARRHLEAMAEAAGLDYRTPALDRIAAFAAERGGAAKPSGAGGGDVAVALLPDPEAAAAFRAACDAEGLTVLSVRVCEGAHEVRD